jgi:glycosyltransferase involved in cell wall biosynthesis
MGNRKQFAKILIVGQNFEDTTGPGITLSNLFSLYPKDKIAVATNRINSNLSFCSRVYVWGRGEYRYSFNTPKANSLIRKITKHAKSLKSRNSFGGYLGDAIGSLLSMIVLFLGRLKGIFSQQKYDGYSYLSMRLYQWIKKYNPDVIYTQLGGIQPIILFEQIRIALQKPYVIHFMDDWIQKTNELTQNIDWYELFFNQVRQADVLMGICEWMAVEYKSRFDRDFLYYHNPVDIDKWGPKSRQDWDKVGSGFVIMFAGKLGRKNVALVEVCRAVHELNSGQDLDIQLHVYTNDFASPEAERLKEYKGIKVFGFVSNEKIIDVMVAADTLLLPLSFEDNYVRVTRLSMPTKTSEYMISGTPILVYAHPDTALNKYASEYEWGYVVSERTCDAIKSAIMDLYSDKDLRKRLGERAISLAQKRHSLHEVSRDFASKLQLSK